MKIHRQLMVLVGFGILSVMAVTILSLQYISATFSRTSATIAQISAEAGHIWAIERQLDRISEALHSYVMTGDGAYMQAYDSARAEADTAIGRAGDARSGLAENVALAGVVADLNRLEKKAARILALPSPHRDQRRLAANLLAELKGLHEWMEHDLERYRRLNASEMDSAITQVHRNTMRINLVFLGILLTSVSFLFAFVVYFRSKISAPLLALWEGTEEISRGNLEFRLQVHGNSDIARLAERFNTMSRQLKASYADLEQKLYERTHELASLDAVALTLSQAGSLKDLLDRALLRVLDSLSGINAKGGIFLCEPGGETLRLTSHHGLPPEFAQREAVIKMGECLCGIVAETGELLYSESDCIDPRHTRTVGEDSHAHVIIPIKSRGIVLGVIFLYPQKEFRLKQSDVQMLDAIGVQLGMAVENFRFYAEVKESSEKYWDLFENATDILFTMDSSGKLTAVNKAAETFSGYSKVELSGMSVFDFLKPEAVENAGKMLQRGFKSRRPIEFEVRKRDGSTAFIEASVRKLLKKKESTGYHVSVRDITEQKHLRDVLLQAERIGAIGQLVVAVRHEVNNPLTTVIGNIELLIERYEGKDKELTVRLTTVLNNALRIAEIVKQLQGIKKDKVVEYVKGIEMTDLKQK